MMFDFQTAEYSPIVCILMGQEVCPSIGSVFFPVIFQIFRPILAIFTKILFSVDFYRKRCYHMSAE